ncbi:hypothetical protein GUITHDRAFT_149116 [Guillardia theta CCMP2712]|uniref:Uncharacterized protein n=1 Tax=Guillardia theta (strain CCMP2712) TaxID=905079 RepID=L1I772_GUITC|nr:hypothetical protein GUITHDRAFT_149116 [Guillardia theta CCMP2712]EKX31719.1 hypothetical protein GUITHDRAFT_149116 [Guillardia theta CCMP2712]|eukprot:XP_005818699.1 hypothetical protein GUITHDRAFT_149116 [Guillardia theta CCMP2712]
MLLCSALLCFLIFLHLAVCMTRPFILALIPAPSLWGGNSGDEGKRISHQMAWTIQLRWPGGQATRELEAGGETPVKSLRALCSQVAGICEGELIIKAGYPPRKVSEASSACNEEGGRNAEVSTCSALFSLKMQQELSIEAVGIVNKDSLIVDRQASENKLTEGKQAPKARGEGKKRKQLEPQVLSSQHEQEESNESEVYQTRSGRRTTCTRSPRLLHVDASHLLVTPSERMAQHMKEMKEREEKPTPPRKWEQVGRVDESARLTGEQGAASNPRKRMPGKGQRLDSSLDSPTPQAPARQEPQLPAISILQLTASYSRWEAVASPLLWRWLKTSWADVNETEAAQTAMAAELVSTFEPGKSKNPLRVSLKNARAQQGAIEMAADRIKAVLKGDVNFIEKQVDGMSASGPDRGRKDRDDHRGRGGGGRMSLMGLQVMTFMLRALLQDEDSTTRVNIKPHNMACVSPRVFWNIVRHCKVGPSTSFEAAFASLVPDEKWDVILSRNQVEHQEGKYRF